MQHPRCKLLIFAVTASLWLQSHKAIAAAPPGSVDLLQAFRFRENSAVETSLGYCRSREGQSSSDVAYKLSKKAVISVPTATVFPNNFPLDFSILTTFKSTDRGQLFTVYSSDGSLILSIRIGRRVVLQYKGGGNGRRDRVRFKLKLDSGMWHRLGISVKGNSVTAILDCNEQDTQEIKRNKVTLKTDGIILFQRDAPFNRNKREARGDAINKRTRPQKDSDVDLITVYTDIYNMRIELEKIKKPTGTRNNPARTCQDLHFGHPQSKDGFYWIDPNLGMVDDAVKVYCNMSAGGETCVSPDLHASRMPNIPWRKSTEGWYSTLRGGFRISYDSLGSVQLTFLRLLSKEAYQNFTYTCINSAAWFDARTGNHNNAIKLQGDNEEEFSALDNQPNILLDGCRNKVRESKTIFEIRTQKLGQLPLVDFYPVDYGKPHQAFGFEVGPVCFR